MNRDLIPSISDPSSPWYTLSEMRKPNVKWCEAQNNTWIIEPANTWSNLAYIIAGLWIARNNKNFKSKAIHAYAWVIIVTGLCSGIYHASFTFVLQILDFFGMYALTYLMMLIQMKRMRWIKNAMDSKNFWGLVIGTTALTVWCDLYTNFPIQSLIGVQTLFILVSEFWTWKKRKSDYSFKFFSWGAAFMSVAITFSILDIKRIMCDPDNHWVQGNAYWHILKNDQGKALGIDDIDPRTMRIIADGAGNIKEYSPIASCDGVKKRIVS